MLKQLTNDPYVGYLSKQTRTRIDQTIDYFRGKINSDMSILDVGQRSPLTSFLESKFNVKIDNTKGDLDDYFKIPGKIYDVIIYSHTIEHQFNPLHTLQILKKCMGVKSRLYIMIPERGKLLWTKGHYHEIDDYRMRLLIERAGMKIISKKRYKVWRHWTQYLTGIRTLYRLFREFNVHYEVMLP